MFCPKCKDEFRPGFTRCERCSVDLVEELSVAEGQRDAAPPENPVRLADFCGFLTLEDAREARDQLRVERIRSEIVLREPPGANWDRPASEEYWLRVEIARIKAVAGILGGIPEVDAPQGADEDAVSCGDCGGLVSADAESCPKCGARFED